MDESCLSDKQVIEATRNYVCVRTSTYENEEEGEFLASVARTRSGELENTVFVLLDPDGRTKLSRGTRGIQRALGGTNSSIARSLDDISEKYKVKSSEPPSALPTAASLRLAINVAACDNQPLVVCLGKSTGSLTKIEKAVAKHAWTEKHLGQFHYVSSSSAEDLSTISGLTIKEGIAIVQPDRFGTEATVLAQLELGAKSGSIDATLTRALTTFDRPPSSKDTRAHRRDGNQTGVFWKTAIPVTDPGRSSQSR